jgi:hypothetical protein
VTVDLSKGASKMFNKLRLSQKSVVWIKVRLDKVLEKSVKSQVFLLSPREPDKQSLSSQKLKF